MPTVSAGLFLHTDFPPVVRIGVPLAVVDVKYASGYEMV
jgi:hypothetical protein